MGTNAIDTLGTQAADAAMKGAVDYLVTKGFKTLRDLPEAEIDQLLTVIREETRNALPKALQDARDAFDAHMGGFAGPTFMASMKLAGVRAGEKWLAGRTVKA